MLCQKRIASNEDEYVEHLFAAHTEEEALFALDSIQGQ
jgi:hypothetical protein